MFLFKKYPKDIFVTAHYEWIQNEGGAIEKRIKVKGKVLALLKFLNIGES